MRDIASYSSVDWKPPHRLPMVTTEEEAKRRLQVWGNWRFG
jgi:hypothetical protein